ncbi:hypothetical protein FOZ62_014140, partial [Perkinsus olseni]
YKIDDNRHRLKPRGWDVVDIIQRVARGVRYIGLTSFVGAAPNQPSYRSDLLNIHDFHVSNHDNSMMSGEPKVTYNPYKAVPRQDFLEDHGGGNGGGKHSDAIATLVRATYRVIMELEPLRSMEERTITELS